MNSGSKMKLLKLKIWKTKKIRTSKSKQKLLRTLIKLHRFLFIKKWPIFIKFKNLEIVWYTILAHSSLYLLFLMFWEANWTNNFNLMHPDEPLQSFKAMLIKFDPKIILFKNSRSSKIVIFYYPCIKTSKYQFSEEVEKHTVWTVCFTALNVAAWKTFCPNNFLRSEFWKRRIFL